MNPAIILGIVVVVIIIAVASYFSLRSNPEVGASAKIGGDVNDAIDSQIEEISNDVANAAREGYISQREYMTPDPAQSIEDLTKSVLTNILGKPVKAIVSRDDVSGVLKVLMTGVDPNVFEPSVSGISDCVSGKIKTSTGFVSNDLPMYAYDCTNEYFSENNLEFEKIVPAALTMYENAYKQYASEAEKEKVEKSGGLKKTFSCMIIHENSPELEQCMNGSEIPKITWEIAKPRIASLRQSLSKPEDVAEPEADARPEDVAKPQDVRETI